MMFPGHLLRYEADKSDPWHYYWVAFDGPAAGDFLQRIGMTPANPVVCHRHPNRIRNAFERMLASAKQRSLKGDLDFIGAFWEELAAMAEDIALASKGTPINGHGQVSQHVAKAVLLIQDGYHRPDFTIEEAASHLCIARGYLGRVFKLHTGVSPHQFLERTRIENACRLLENYSLAVKEVGVTVGFRDQNYFDKVFRKKTRLSPSEYRHALQKKAGRATSSVERELLSNLNS
jgi:AraC-like DNA-binding protein